AAAAAFTGAACATIGAGVAGGRCGAGVAAVGTGLVLATSAGVGVSARAIGACGAGKTAGADCDGPSQPASRPRIPSVGIIKLCGRGMSSLDPRFHLCSGIQLQK